MMNLGKSGKKIMIIIGGIKDNLTSYMPFLTRKAMAKNHSFSFFISFGALNFRGVEVVENDKNHGI